MRHDFDSFTIWIVAQHVPGNGERRFICVINLINEGIAVFDEKLDQVHAFQSDGQVQDAVALLEFLMVERTRSIGISSIFRLVAKVRPEGFRLGEEKN